MINSTVLNDTSGLAPARTRAGLSGQLGGFGAAGGDGGDGGVEVVSDLVVDVEMIDESGAVWNDAQFSDLENHSVSL